MTDDASVVRDEHVPEFTEAQASREHPTLRQIEKNLETLLRAVRRRMGKSHLSQREMRKLAAALQLAQRDLECADGVLDALVARCVALEQVPPVPDRLPGDFDGWMAELRRLAPHAFAAWHPLLEANRQAYEADPLSSCSTEDHRGAQSFRRYLLPRLRGRVLDIGCGPYPVPLYLAGYPLDRIAALDPLAPVEPHPFAFVHGVAEFLPWPDRSFETVVIATSLDHVLLPDRVFPEIVRVLVPRGQLIVWTSCVEGARPYNPYGTDVGPVDEFHLFHVDVGGFERMVAPWLCIFDRHRASDFEYYFSLTPKA